MDVHLFHNFKYMVSISAFWVWDIYIPKFFGFEIIYIYSFLSMHRDSLYRCFHWY